MGGLFQMKRHLSVLCIALIAAFASLAGNGPAKAASAGEINASVNATLDRFYRQIPGARELSARAAGVLVFPTVVKAGFGVGGEYGEGAMRIGGKTAGYYNTI
jgi:lipid-binding SYLF domain-containing protein